MGHWNLQRCVFAESELFSIALLFGVELRSWRQIIISSNYVKIYCAVYIWYEVGDISKDNCDRRLRGFPADYADRCADCADW